MDNTRNVETNRPHQIRHETHGDQEPAVTLRLTLHVLRKARDQHTTVVPAIETQLPRPTLSHSRLHRLWSVLTRMVSNV